MERTAPHLTHPMPMVMPARLGHAAPAAASPRAGLCAGDVLRRSRPHLRPTTLPRRAASPRPRPSSSPRAAPRRPARRAAHLGRPARGRRPAGHDRRPHGRGVRRPRPHPRPGAVRDRHPGRAARRADRRDAHRHAPARSSTPPASGPATLVPERHAAPQPRHPPGAPPGEPARSPGLGLLPDPRRDQPVRRWCSPSRTARSTSGSPTSRSTARSPTCPSRPSPRSASCSTSSRRRSPTSCTADDVSARTPGSGRCSPRRTATRARPPTCPAGTRCSPAATGVVTVVGGKLTTYRRMAEDAVDAAVAHAGLDAGPCRTTRPAAARRRAARPARRAGGAGPAGAPLRHRRRAGARQRPRGQRARRTTSCSRRSPTACR